MRRWLNVGLLLALVACLIPSFAIAQETTGSIGGTVVGASGTPLAGARVSVTSDRGTREATTDSQGRFLLAFLTPGSYSVAVSAAGHQTIQDDGLAVGLGQRVNRRYVLPPVMEETMDVVAPAEMAAPPINMNVQSTGANIPTEIAEQLPLGRNISSVVFLAPGVKSGGGTGTANPSVSGSSGLENQYVFDGVNVTNAGYGALGGYSIIHGSQGTGINFNFVQETQVITGGFAPEYGQAMGGIVNLVTKSGSNEWTGSLSGYWSPDGLEATRRTPQLSSLDIGPNLGVERMDFGADIGGPIVKDKVFFWLGINPSTVRTTRRAPFTDRDANGVPDFLLYNEGPLTREDESMNWSGKITFQVDPDHRLDLSAFGDPTKTNNTFARGSSTLVQDTRKQFSSLDYGYENFSLKYQGQFRPTFLVQAQVATAKNTFDEKFAAEFDQNRILDYVPLLLGTGPVGVQGGIGFFETSTSKNDQYSAKFTNIVGNHEIRYGIGTERITYGAATDRTGPGAVTDTGSFTTTGTTALRWLGSDFGVGVSDPGVTETMDTDGDTVPDEAIVYYALRGLVTDPVKDTASDYTHVFVQDDWSITPDLHLIYGLRWERQSIEGEEIKYTFPSEISPRVGFSWDHTGRGASKLYGHVGRFYEKIPLDMAVRVFSPETGIDAVYYDRDQTSLVPGTYSEIGGEADDVVPGTRNSFTDGLVLGYEQLVGQNERWKIKGEAHYRKLGRILEDIAINADPAICAALGAGTMHIGNWSELLAILQPGSQNEDILGTAETCGYVMTNIRGAELPGGVGYFADPERKYKAMVLEVTRQADDRWFLNFQYTLSRLEGNYEGLFRNDNGQSDPNLTSLYDYAAEPAFYETYSNGPLNTDRTHRFQIFGFRNWANGWFLNGRGVLQSGIPKLELASHPVYGNEGEVQLSRRGSLGRTPTEWTLDAGFGKHFKLATRYESKITLSMDIFNVLNHTYATDHDFAVDNASSVSSPADYAELLDQVANGAPNPDYLRALNYSAPRSVRFGVKWTF